VVAACLGSLVVATGLDAGAAGALVEADPIALVSHTPAGPTTAAAGTSGSPVSSADGAFVAFVSDAPDVVGGQVDANGSNDVFLYERATGAVTLVSHVPGSPGTAANGDSRAPSISADGAFVAFESSAADLVSGQSDPNVAGDIFVFERATGAVHLVSHAAAGPTTAGNRFSRSPVISADGRSVAFESRATDLVAGQVDTNNLLDVFVFERATGAVTLVSHTAASPTTAGNGVSLSPSIDAGGRFVAFVSAATDLVNGLVDTNAADDVFVFDRGTGSLTTVSHPPGNAGATAAGASGTPVISGDGAFVAFVSFASDLAAGTTDANGDAADVFLHERATGAVALVSHAAAASTTTSNGYSFLPSISHDGGFVAFASTGTDLVTGQTDTSGAFDVFVYSRAAGGLVLVSHTPASATTAANRFSTRPQISANAKVVAFESAATDLVTGQVDANDATDLFVSQVASGTTGLVSHEAAGPTTAANGDSDSASVSGNGAFVAFQSTATNLVPGQVDLNEATDVFQAAGQEGRAAPADFDGDGDTDVSVFRPSTGTWFVRNGPVSSFGTSGDVPVPGDYDGDGDTDIAVFRPASGVWFVQGGATAAWGTSGDIPVPGDYDGDGDTDMAVFRPSTGIWFVRGGTTVAWGASGDIPVPGDYDGDGDTDIAVYRPATGTWFVLGGAVTPFGTSGDVPLPLPDAIRRFVPASP
jgi:Tol biopolymer transport system component